MSDSSLTENRQKVETHIRDINDMLSGVVSDDMRDLITRVIDVTYDYGLVDGIKSVTDIMQAGIPANEEA